MRQTGHWDKPEPMTSSEFTQLLVNSIDNLDVDQARQDVAPFVKDPRMLEIWSRDFFRDVAGRIQTG